MIHRKQLACLILAAILCLLSACTRTFQGTTAKELLDERYYDWSSGGYSDPDGTYHYTFYLDHAEWTAADAKTLPDEAFRAAEEKELQTVFILWEGNGRGTECSGQEEGTGKYYKLPVDGYGLLLIPSEYERTWFEEARPLAFYLIPA